MNNIKKNRLTAGLLWGLAAYCAYGMFSFYQYISSVPENLPYLPFTVWLNQAVFLLGTFFYMFWGYQLYQGRASIRGLRIFQIFSGVFAGLRTGLLWSLISVSLLQSEIIYPSAFVMVKELVLLVFILLAARMVTRMAAWDYGVKWLLLSFAATVLIFGIRALLHSTGLVNMPPEFFIGVTIFAACVIFFPRVTETALTMFAVFCVAIFSAVGGIWRR